MRFFPFYLLRIPAGERMTIHAMYDVRQRMVEGIIHMQTCFAYTTMLLHVPSFHFSYVFPLVESLHYKFQMNHGHFVRHII